MDIIIFILVFSLNFVMTELFCRKEMKTYPSGLVRGIALSVIVAAEMVFSAIYLDSLWIKILFIGILSIYEIGGIIIVITITLCWRKVKKEEKESTKLYVDSKNIKIVV